MLTPQSTPTLKQIVLAGEPITPETFFRWADHVRVIAAYGPSETSIYSSACLEVSKYSDSSCIGKAIGCTQWIVDPEEHERLSAIGVVGEIAISGALLADGYLENSALTDEFFVQAPGWFRALQPDSGFHRIYKSGDLARYNPDGTLTIVGRKDTQVKLRGYRIELGAIESRLMEQGLASAALVTMPTTPGPCKGQIVAVVSLRMTCLGYRDYLGSFDLVGTGDDEATNDIEMLKHRVSLALPHYMVPTVWAVIQRLPLLASGKIDRKTIRSWVNDMSSDTYHDIMQVRRSQVEQPDVVEGAAKTLRDIWCEVLSLSTDRIGLASTYISLGGDSISAIRVASAAKASGIPITVNRLLSRATLGDITENIEHTLNLPMERTDTYRKELDEQFHRQSNVWRRNLVPHAQMLDAYPMTPMQRQISKSRRINSSVFLILWSMEIIPASDETNALSKIAQAWKRVVSRVPILKSTFYDCENAREGLQVVIDNVDPPHVVSSFLQEQIPSHLDQLLPKVDDCLLPHRAHFYKHGDRYFADIEFDHRVIDGWSFALIREELVAQYEGRSCSTLKPSVPYKEFVLAHVPQQTQLDIQYWKKALEGISPSVLSLPAKTVLATESADTQKTILSLPRLPVESLTSFSAENDVTPASIFYAAWAQTLASYTSSTSVSFEYVVWGRDLDVPGILDIIGPLLNVLPFHLDHVGDQGDRQSLALLAKQIQEQRLRDGSHTLCNPREVVQRDLKMPLPFNTAVNFQRRPTSISSSTVTLDDRLTSSSDPWHFSVMARIIHDENDDTYFMTIEFDETALDPLEMENVRNTFFQKVQAFST